MAEPGRRLHRTRLWHGTAVRRVEFVARVVVVLSFVAAFDIVVPDFVRTITKSSASGIAQSGLLLAVDAADTASYSGSGTTWTDLSGNGRNGTLTSAVVAASTSTTPRSLTTGSGKYATFPSGFSDFTAGITVQATLDFGTADNWERIVDFGNGTASNNILFSRFGSTNDLWFEFYSSSSTLGRCLASGAIKNNEVHNYAVTVVPSGGSTSCVTYRDGVVVSSSNTLSGMPLNVSRSANFAAHSNWGADTDLGASYKSLLIYDRALSGSEISSNYTADRTPLAPTGLATSTTTQTSVALSWTAPTTSGASSIADYVIEYSTNNSDWNLFADGTSSSTSATVTGLSAGTNYYFRVSASNASLTGPVSSSVQKTTTSPYTLTYDSQGGSAVSAQSWINGQTWTLPTPTRTGYTFSGWSTSSTGSAKVYETTNPTRSGGNIVYTSGYGKAGGDAAATLTSAGATFSKVTFRMDATYSGTPYFATVTFDKWAGATIADLAVPDIGDTRTVKADVTNLYVNSNWPGFAGVASAVTNGSGKSGRVELWPWDYGTATSSVSPAGNGSIYDNDDTSTGGASYGSFQVHNLTDAQTVLAWNHHGVAAPDIGFGNNLQYCNGLNTDWTFCGKTNFDVSTWKLRIFIGDLFAGGSTFVPPSNADSTLYAQWTADTLAVTYDSHGGSAISNGSTVTGGSIAASPGTPTRAGYTFNGWFAAASGGSAITFPYSHGQTSAFTLHAQWTANTLAVTYDSRGGSSISSGSTVTGGSIAASPGTPTKGTDTFRGWFAASSGGSAITFPYAHGRTANFTLYAQWQTDQAALTVTNAPASLTYQTSVTLGTSGGNGTGAVSYATTTPSVCSVNAGTGAVTMLAGTGTCSVAATKAADNDYKAAYGSVDITATRAGQSALTVSGSASGTYGSTVNLTATGGSTAGAVTWSDGSSTACTVDSSGVVSITSGTGSCAVTASMAGNSNYDPVTSAGYPITVAKAAQAVLTVTSTEVDYGDTLELRTSGGSGSGAVTWAKVSGTCTVSDSTLTPGNAGSSCVVKATKTSDARYQSRTSSDTTVTVSKGTQTGFRVTGQTSFTTGGTLSLTATGGQSSGLVSWSVSTGTCALAGSVLSSTRGGVTCVVVATKAGDSNYLAVSDTQTITVSKITQNLTFRSTAPSPSTVGSNYTVSVDSDAFLAPTVVIANSSSAVCSVFAGVVSFLATGTCLISASQSGNDTYTSAAASQSVTVVLPASIAPTTIPGLDASGATPTTVTASGAAAPGSATTTTVTPPQSGATGNKSATATPATVPPTTTTTTTVPSDSSRPQTGADGKAPELNAGEATAIVRGQAVSVKVDQVDNSLVLTLPNDVKVAFGPSSAGSKSATVAADGVLRMYREEFVDVVVTGLIPGTTYTVFMFSTPVELGRGIADANGRVMTRVQIPKGVEANGHTLQVNGVGPGGEVVTTSIGITVLKRTSNTRLTVLVLVLAVLLALFGGRPVYIGRRRRRRAA